MSLADNSGDRRTVVYGGTIRRIVLPV